MKTLNDYLQGIYNEGQEKVAAASLEDQLMQLSPEELLKIASEPDTALAYNLQSLGRHLKAKMEHPLSPPWSKERQELRRKRGEEEAAHLKAYKARKAESTKEASLLGPGRLDDEVKNLIKKVIRKGKSGIEKIVESPVGTAKAVVKKLVKKGSADTKKLAWADDWGRQLAQVEVEAAKVANLRQRIKLAYDIGPTGGPKFACGFEKATEFTSPEAQQKAKVVQHAMKATKGAPSHVRKAAVKVTAEKMKTSAYDPQGDVTPESWWAGQKGINRAMRSPDAEGAGKLIADPALIGRRTLRGLKHGLIGTGLGLGGGAAVGGVVGGGRGALLGALLGGGLGTAIGHGHGMHSADKEWLGERGITPTMLGMGRGRFTREAAEKYLAD